MSTTSLPPFFPMSPNSLKSVHPSRCLKSLASQSLSNCCNAAVGKNATRRRVSRIILASVVNAVLCFSLYWSFRFFHKFSWNTLISPAGPAVVLEHFELEKRTWKQAKEKSWHNIPHKLYRSFPEGVYSFPTLMTKGCCKAGVRITATPGSGHLVFRSSKHSVITRHSWSDVHQIFTVAVV